MLDLYVFPINCPSDILNEKRKEYINSLNSKKSKLLSKCAWAYLESLLLVYYDIDPQSTEFNVINGKWMCKDICFSISHDDVIAIAISDKNVGVDVSNINRMDIKLGKRILNDVEYDVFLKTEEENKKMFLSKMWTLKEAIYKRENNGNFVARNISAIDSTDARVYNFLYKGVQYVLAVSSSEKNINVNAEGFNLELC